MGLYGETCPTSRDADQATGTKVEQVSDVEEERDPIQITFPGIKAQLEVSCVK
jgi:hypothetical protein